MEGEEAAVASHQTFQDVYNKCCVWIRTFTDKLASCCEGHNEKEKLQANIDQIEVILRIVFSYVSMKFASLSIKTDSNDYESLMRQVLDCLE